MALWGNKDNVTSTGTVSLDYSTGQVTGSATTFVTDLSEGQIIRFGINDGVGTYFGDAVICLLYTSPSPRDRQKSRMPSSA